MILFIRRSLLIILILSVLPITGCLGMFLGSTADRTHIIAVPYGSNEQRNNFKYGTIKPGGHIV